MQVSTCGNCLNAVKKSEEAALTRWLEHRGLAFCKAYSKRLQTKFLIPLNNAAGMVCGGRNYKAAEHG